MNIYDEAIEILKQIRRVDGNMSREQNQRYAELGNLLIQTKKQEERAKKADELLDCYRESWKSMRVGRLEKKIEKL